MKRILGIIFALAIVIFAGCKPANIAAVRWESNIPAANAQTRCEQVDLRKQSDMDAVFPKYDGWKLIYISEYTTGNKTGTDAAVCFQRAKQ